jgi:hypothetical protein
VNEKAVVRAAALAVTAGGAVLPLFMAVPAELPYDRRMTAEPKPEAGHEERAETLTKAELLRRAEEALARQLEHRERYFAARDRFLKRARSR